MRKHATLRPPLAAIWRLKPHDAQDLIDTLCPGRCFKFNYHRNPSDGKLLHGHFIMKNAGDT